MGWSHIHMWWWKKRRDILTLEVPPEEWGVWAPTSGSLAQCSSARKINPHNVWLWKPAEQNYAWVRWRYAGVPDISVKGPAHELTCSEFQHWGSNWKGTRDMQGGIELSGWRGSFLQTVVLAEAIILKTQQITSKTH